jgi:hypothetical protein
VIKLTFFLSACQRERTIVSHGDRDPSVDRPDQDHDGGSLRAEKERKRRMEKEKDRREDRGRRERERDYEHDRGRDRERLSHKRKSDHKAEDSGAEPLLDADQNFGMHPMSSTCDDIHSLKIEYVINTVDLESTNLSCIYLSFLTNAMMYNVFLLEPRAFMFTWERNIWKNMELYELESSLNYAKKLLSLF